MGVIIFSTINHNQVDVRAQNFVENCRCLTDPADWYIHAWLGYYKDQKVVRVVRNVEEKMAPKSVIHKLSWQYMCIWWFCVFWAAFIKEAWAIISENATKKKCVDGCVIFYRNHCARRIWLNYSWYWTSTSYNLILEVSHRPSHGLQLTHTCMVQYSIYKG